VSFICAKYSDKNKKSSPQTYDERIKHRNTGHRYIIVRMNMFSVANRDKWREVGNDEMISSLVDAMNNAYHFHDASAFEFDSSSYWSKLGF